MERIEPRFLVLMGLCELKRANIYDLLAYTSLPIATLRRALASLRTDLKMDIQYVRGPDSGYYVIKDWGVIDRKKFSDKYVGCEG